MVPVCTGFEDESAFTEILSPVRPLIVMVSFTYLIGLDASRIMVLVIIELVINTFVNTFA